jgi:hypothetical protein
MHRDYSSEFQRLADKFDADCGIRLPISDSEILQAKFSWKNECMMVCSSLAPHAIATHFFTEQQSLREGFCSAPRLTILMC